MSDRRARVILSSGEEIDLCGLAAGLVALVATRSLSPRTMAVLCQWVAHEPTIGAIAYGMIEVDLMEHQARLYRRDRLPNRKPLSALDQEEQSDVA